MRTSADSPSGHRLVAGVPIVCMPTGRDQPDNAARLTHHGAGVKISKNATPAKIAAAVRQVLDRPSYQAAAARLGEQLRAEADSGTALAELEALTKPARQHSGDGAAVPYEPDGDGEV